MGEIPRQNFEAKLANAPLAAQGFFESVIEHFDKRNSVKVHFTDTNSGDLRLAVPGEVLGQRRLRNFATMYWQTSKHVVFARTFLSPDELGLFGILDSTETASSEPLNSEVRMGSEVWRYGALTFIRALEAAHFAFLGKHENN
ncbi:hypothetical protein N9Q06_00375 [bacterium]|nr:hypothetical protein [bacterium]